MPVMTQPTNEVVAARGPLDLTKPLDARDPVLDATAAQLAHRRPSLEPGAGGATDSQAMSMKRIADALEAIAASMAANDERERVLRVESGMEPPNEQEKARWAEWKVALEKREAARLIAEPMRAIPEEKRPRGRPPK